MRKLVSIFVLMLLAISAPALRAATPATSTLQPALTKLQSALDSVNVERWKTPAVLRDETRSDIESIRKDISGTLPALFSAADATPASVAASLPLLRNVDALYDVALRISATSRTAAPADQSGALQDALANLRDARQQFGDSVQAAAAAQEKRTTDLQAALSAQPVPTCPTQPAAPAKKSTRKSTKPAASKN